jgi:hypothetical protein
MEHWVEQDRSKTEACVCVQTQDRCRQLVAHVCMTCNVIYTYTV